jgi:hypothetical protein
MKLIGSLASPYVRKVRVVLAEKSSITSSCWKMCGPPTPPSATQSARQSA